MDADKAPQLAPPPAPPSAAAAPPPTSQPPPLPPQTHNIPPPPLPNPTCRRTMDADTAPQLSPAHCPRPLP